MPLILAAKTHFDAGDAGLSRLKELTRAEVIRSHMLLERDGIRFGLFGIMGTDSIQIHHQSRRDHVLRSYRGGSKDGATVTRR